MAAGGMGFGWMEENKKSASPKKNCGYRSYRGYREDSTAGVWRGQGLFMVRHLEMAVCFAIMWGVAKWWWMVDFLEEC